MISADLNFIPGIFIQYNFLPERNIFNKKSATFIVALFLFQLFYKLKNVCQSKSDGSNGTNVIAARISIIFKSGINSFITFRFKFIT